MEYYQQAGGDPEAQVKIGYIYENGYEIQKSYFKAKECYENAGKRGNLNALLRLGDFYLYGLGGKKDYVLSYAYYTLVIRLIKEGSEHPRAKELAQQAEDARKRLLPRIWNFWTGLKHEEIKEAEELANSWEKGYLLTRKRN
ncbi:MAG: tetratricopeptide repeat protein [Candidatus Hydrogenedens sp.]